MISFKIDKCNLSESELLKSNNKATKLSPYNLKNTFGDLKDRLNQTKSMQDSYFANRDFKSIVLLYDMFRKMKYELSKNVNGQNISNAWLKIYEILNFVDLIEKDSKELVHFDNCSFPGSFILAVNHYAKTIGKVKKYSWLGSSLISLED